MDSKAAIHDELLVLQCQEGDVKAFEQLLDRWQDPLWRHACRLTGDQDAAWDAIQEAWIDISSNIRRLRDVTAFRSWIYCIVTNKCRDWLRKESRRHRIIKDYPREKPVDTQPQLAILNPAASIQDGLQQLSGADRSILVLRYEEDLSTAEIAAVLGIPEGTVKSRLHYAREHLRKVLEANNHE